MTRNDKWSGEWAKGEERWSNIFWFPDIWLYSFLYPNDDFQLRPSGL